MSDFKMAKNDIRISEKHGLNPSMPVCFLCGETKNEIVLFGRLKGDAEAPRHCIIDYEPCDKCKEKYKNDAVFIEASHNEQKNGLPPTTVTIDGKESTIYPTGKYYAVPAEIFVNQEPGPRFCDVGVIDMIQKQVNKAIENSKTGDAEKNEQKEDDVNE